MPASAKNKSENSAEASTILGVVRSCYLFVNVLFVSVDVEASVTKVELPPELGNVKVFEALSE